MPSSAILVFGLQWGDEGKGKLVHLLCKSAQCCARYNGGNNAGHTIVDDTTGATYAFHLLPCGIVFPQVKSFIGNGVVLNLKALAKECDLLNSTLGRSVELSLYISSRVQLNFSLHQYIDSQLESDPHKGIGTTLRGIGPSYAGKALRLNLRGSDLMLPFHLFKVKYERQAHFFNYPQNLIDQELSELEPLIQRFAPRIVDCVDFLSDIIHNNENDQTNELRSPPSSIINGIDIINTHWTLVIESANAAMLDINVGTYPFCTSSDTLPAGIGGGLSFSPRKVNQIIGVAKAYCTRVGNGPFPTECFDDTGFKMRSNGREFGTSTGRPRRCGWFDAQAVRYAGFVAGVDLMMLTKLDVLTGMDVVKICTGYAELEGRPNSMPASVDELEKVTCVYCEYPGWAESLGECQTWDELPKNAQSYVEAIEKLVGIRIAFIGVGPKTSQIITR